MISIRLSAGGSIAHLPRRFDLRASVHNPARPMSATTQQRRPIGADSPVRALSVALLLVAAAMTAVVASLWLTEPTLPTRTAVACGVMTLMGLSWMVSSGWVLTTRRPLFG